MDAEVAVAAEGALVTVEAWAQVRPTNMDILM